MHFVDAKGILTGGSELPGRNHVLLVVAPEGTRFDDGYRFEVMTPEEYGE